MKTLLPTFYLAVVLAAFSWVLANAAGGDMTQRLAACMLFALPPLAVWLTARAVAALPEQSFWRVGFWAVTIASWLALFVVSQGRGESHPDERQNFVVAFAFAVVVGTVARGQETFPPAWRMLGEVMASVVVVALACAALACGYDAKTRSIAARASRRWSEIGLSMADFERTLAPRRENMGSEIVRQVLREQVNSRFYKDGTPAAEREPAIERSKATEDRVARACEIIYAKLPPSDDLDLSLTARRCY